jgi:hypothetical protein
VIEYSQEAARLANPDLWPEVSERFGDCADIFIVQARIEEAQIDSTVMHELADLRACLQAHGLLDDLGKTLDQLQQE